MTSRRLPDWIRRPLHTGEGYGRVQALLRANRLNTVCRDARCPNRRECWSRGTATFLLLGDVCTRDCRFCAVATGRPAPPEADEAERIARTSAELGLRHVVLTSVTRDDLPDGGASVFAAAVRALRARLSAATVEVLTPDFQGDTKALDLVLDASPDVFNHNLETVRRLQPDLRPQARYDRSLGVLRHAARRVGGAAVKSGLMLGLGETGPEVEAALRDLFEAGCRRVTLGQYLAPTRTAWPVARFVEPREFEAFGRLARGLGFEEVASAPLVRSSYRADEMLPGARPRKEAWPCPGDIPPIVPPHS